MSKFKCQIKSKIKMSIQKFQIQNYKYQINYNVQNPKLQNVWNFEFDIWDLFGAWYFEFVI